MTKFFRPIFCIFTLCCSLIASSPAHSANIFLSHCGKLLSFGHISEDYLKTYDEFCQSGACEAFGDAQTNHALTQALRGENENPFLRMTAASFIKNHPGFSNELKSEAAEVIRLLQQDSRYTDLKTFFGEIEERSHYYIDDPNLNKITLTNIYKDLHRVSKDISFGRVVRNQNYPEVLPDTISDQMRRHQLLFQALEESLQPLHESNALTQLEKLLSDPSFSVGSPATFERLKFLSDGIQKKLPDAIKIQTNYVIEFNRNLKAFLDQTAPQMQELSTPTHADKILLMNVLKGVVKRQKTPIQAFAEFRTWIQQYEANQYKVMLFGKPVTLPLISPLLARANKISELIQRMLFKRVDASYSNGSSVSLGNDGITAYIQTLLIKNRPLRKMAIRFYLDLAKLTPLDRVPQRPYSFWEKTTHNIWDIALKATRRTVEDTGSPLHAFEVIDVFGHNDVYENFEVSTAELEQFSQVERGEILRDFSLLNHLRPPRSSPLYAPGAIPGFEVPKPLLDQMQGFYQDLKKSYELYPHLYKEPERIDRVLMKTFRSGYYHFYGGTFITAELMAHQEVRLAGVNIPVTLSYLLGHYYKKITMEADYLDVAGKFLFREMNYRSIQKMSEAELAKFLIKVNQAREAKNLAAWTLDELRVHKLDVDINLLHLEITAYQHTDGAYQLYQLLKNDLE